MFVPNKMQLKCNRRLSDSHSVIEDGRWFPKVLLSTYNLTVLLLPQKSPMPHYQGATFPPLAGQGLGSPLWERKTINIGTPTNPPPVHT